ncbi:ABC transporter permease subunit [Pontibacillus yanchengensis]|uniref:ABC transporter permease subunit n=2 Tax=Pontibacillus yanchengensis TaxID=462910 RepID=A0ACC7VI36_9BACI|nr:proline/glycine betaine ABC transporter permease [Pontibacillus yanchengensis]MYL34321.1 ABC transporter permease subunit [Pontibacillus yanchengensis]MYL53789.1 ABC transporter permease subunit [Pontibacillus yanchengensis]
MNYFYFPLEEWTNSFVNNWLLPVMGGFFNALSGGLSSFINAFTNVLTAVPPEVIALILVALSWRIVGKGVALFTLLGCIYLGSVNLWDAAMQTITVVFVSTLISIVIGVPLGILSALNGVVNKITRPVLDFMQTLPSFVYLIPAILLFGLGGVPAVIATFVFATPPAVRMTSLGIQQVPGDVVEASRAFGSTSSQLLYKVQLPMAVPTIMAGINQTIMLALSMAVIASMIGAPGLGSTVLEGISNVNVGLGLTGGLGIVVLAIILDRITQGLGQKV